MAHILVVDDARNILKMVRITLERVGHQVETARDAEAGIAAFGDGSGFDLLLIDQRLPGLQGQELIREVRRLDPGARIIMMTAYPSVELASEVIKSGAVDFVRKPFAVELLRGAVGAALARPKHPDATDSPTPGASAATPPQITYYFNGFDFWPVAVAAETEPQDSGETKRAFLVRDPQGQRRRCVVVVTPHVCAQVREECLQENPEGEIWDVVCRDTLANFLWYQAILPPDVLPVFELAPNQLYDVQVLSRVQNRAD